MRFSEFVYAHSNKTKADPMEFVAHVHDAVEAMLDVALDYTVRYGDRLPWSADEITRHVEAFINTHVPAAEKCAESQWDDRA